MRCAECRERLEDRLDGLLSAAEAGEIEGHLTICAACAAEARALARLDGMLRECLAPPTAMPTGEALERLVPVASPRAGADRGSISGGRVPSRVARGWIAAAAVLLAVWTAGEGMRNDTGADFSAGTRPSPAGSTPTKGGAGTPVVPDDGGLPSDPFAPSDPPVDPSNPPDDRDPAPEDPPVDWAARLRGLAALPESERKSSVVAWEADRAAWEPVFVDALRAKAPHADAAWIGLAPILGVQAARPALHRMLADADRRPAALLALARLRDPIAVSAAFGAMRVPSERSLGLEALSLAQPEGAVPVLLEAARDDNLVEHAIGLLAGLGDRVDSELARRLASRDRSTVREALKMTARLRRDPLVSRMIPLLSSPSLRPDAIEALLEMRRPESVGPLLDAMSDIEFSESIAAGLPSFGAAGLAQLRLYLRSPLPEIRSRAAEVLGRAKDRGATSALCAALADPAARRSAIVALGSVGDAAAIRALEGLLHDPTHAAAAVSAIGRIGGESALAPLLRACHRRATALAALSALGRVRSSRALPPLLAGLRESYTASTAARSLAEHGDRKAVPALIAVLHRRDVREDALAALRTLTDQDLGPDPAAWIDWWQRRERDSRRPDPPGSGNLETG